jgi:hypothetical protein
VLSHVGSQLLLQQISVDDQQVTVRAKAAVHVQSEQGQGLDVDEKRKLAPFRRLFTDGATGETIVLVRIEKERVAPWQFTKLRFFFSHSISFVSNQAVYPTAILVTWCHPCCVTR